MIRVFSGGKDAERDETTDPTQAKASDDRISQGLELLFGAQMGDYLDLLRRHETQAAERMTAIEDQLKQQAESLGDLADKAKASLDREQGEHQRRKGIEVELGEKLGRLRTALDIALEEIDKKLAQADQMLDEKIRSLQSSQRDSAEERDEKLIEALSEDLHSLETSKVSRTELATLLANVARELTPAKTTK